MSVISRKAEWLPVCILYDFDGVMTDNRVYIDENGKESVLVNRSDGMAVSLIRNMGIAQAIISTETNPVVERRAKKLQIPAVHGISDKGEAVKQYCDAHGYDLSDTMFIGNDINDLSALEIVGYRGCPFNAANEVISISDWISCKNGGCGVIRDLYGALQNDTIQKIKRSGLAQTISHR